MEIRELHKLKVPFLQIKAIITIHSKRLVENDKWDRKSETSFNNFCRLSKTYEAMYCPNET